MSQVLMMLASTDIASLPTPKQPGFAARSQELLRPPKTRRGASPTAALWTA